jgi:hypothetical protein
MIPSYPIFSVDGFKNYADSILPLVSDIDYNTGDILTATMDIDTVINSFVAPVTSIQTDLSTIRVNTTNIYSRMAGYQAALDLIKTNTLDTAGSVSNSNVLLAEILADQVGEITFLSSVAAIEAAIAAAGTASAAGSAAVVAAIEELEATVVAQAVASDAILTSIATASILSSTYLSTISSSLTTSNTTLSNILTTLGNTYTVVHSIYTYLGSTVIDTLTSISDSVNPLNTSLVLTNSYLDSITTTLATWDTVVDGGLAYACRVVLSV